MSNDFNPKVLSRMTIPELQNLRNMQMGNQQKIMELLTKDRDIDMKSLALRRIPHPILHPIWNKFSDYLALVLGILLFIWLMGVAYNATNKKKKTSPARQQTYKRQQTPSLYQRFTDFTSGIFSPLSTATARWNPFRGDPPTIPRPTRGSGRCDNITWRDMGGEGKPGLCVRTHTTPTTVWTLDMDSMPEMNKIPQPIQDQLVGQNGSGLQIHIPWEAQSTFYVPQCEKAYILYKHPDGREERKAAGHLLEEQGLSCKLREVPSTTYYGKQYRPRNSTQRDNWASPENPKCN